MQIVNAFGMMHTRKQKSGNKDKTFQIIVFVTAVLNLIHSLVDLVNKLVE